jgi:hypothetical protein
MTLFSLYLFFQALYFVVVGRMDSISYSFSFVMCRAVGLHRRFLRSFIITQRTTLPYLDLCMLYSISCCAKTNMPDNVNFQVLSCVISISTCIV